MLWWCCVGRIGKRAMERMGLDGYLIKQNYLPSQKAHTYPTTALQTLSPLQQHTNITHTPNPYISILVNSSIVNMPQLPT